jgi:hypothetical protein
VAFVTCVIVPITRASLLCSLPLERVKNEPSVTTLFLEFDLLIAMPDTIGFETTMQDSESEWAKVNMTIC